MVWARNEGASFASIVVPTMDTTRLTYLIDTLAARRKPLMLVGNSGCGKTAIINGKPGLRHQSPGVEAMRAIATAHSRLDVTLRRLKSCCMR